MAFTANIQAGVSIAVKLYRIRASPTSSQNCVGSTNAMDPKASKVVGSGWRSTPLDGTSFNQTQIVDRLPHIHYTSTDHQLHQLTCGISSLLHSVNLILFTLLLVHLILHISPHHSHHLHSHHLSLPRLFTPDLKSHLFYRTFPP